MFTDANGNTPFIDTLEIFGSGVTDNRVVNPAPATTEVPRAKLEARKKKHFPKQPWYDCDFRSKN